MQACVCDTGYTGPNCDMKMCPKGDDPLTPFSDYYSITLHVTATSGTLGGSIQFIFNGEVISFPAHGAAFTTNICKQIFESLNNIGEVRCTRTAGVDAYGGHVTTVHFHHFPHTPV